MAGSSFFMLLDDIAAVADDVAVMAKAATKKTAGVLGDDLALNAEQVTGINSNRELPVVWAVFKGAMLNKLILVPVALLISFFANWLITPLLMIGGAYLCFEGFEKIWEKFFHKEDVQSHVQAHKSAIKDSTVDMVKFEKEKIKGAIRTDFILSGEIIAIVLGVIGTASISKQIAVLSLVAIGVTIMVYGLVAMIVRMDDVGFWFKRHKNIVSQTLGMLMVQAVPYIMKFLSFFGTLAMFLVGGGIIVHGVGFIHHIVQDLMQKSQSWAWATEMVANGITGLIVGAILVAIIHMMVAVKNKLVKPKVI